MIKKLNDIFFKNTNNIHRFKTKSPYENQCHGKGKYNLI